MLEVIPLCGQIYIGKQGENLARVVCFEEPTLWKDALGEGKCELVHQRYGDSAPYPVKLDIEDDKVYWIISNADNANVGEGKCELRYVVGDVVVKSKTWTTVVLEALGSATEEVPDPFKTWSDKVLDAADDVMSATTHQPVIGDNKNWFVWDAESKSYVDTGVVAEGHDGKDGYTPVKGTDYWTDADKVEINAYIDEQLSNDDDYEMYFDITEDGVVSLKPEYRGAMLTSAFPGAVSDQGLNKVGSKYNELPETIVVPDIVNEIAVTSLIDAMFGYNEKVKSVAIPSIITELPPYFARQAINLQEIKGTENVKILGRGALYRTAIKKASFPNLEELNSSGQQFTQCACLISVDFGKVKSIPKQTFSYCERLSCVYNANDVVSVADDVFLFTRRLKNLNFLPKLTSIGVNGFRNSRIDFDWSTLDCTFGTNATVLQYNPTDWWSSSTFTACNTPMKSVFDQNDPRWVNNKIGDTDITYTDGCMITCASMIYSALEGVEIASPQEFEQIVREINPSLMALNTTQMTNIKSYLEAVGYTVEYKTAYNADNLQAMYNALENGSLVLASTDDGTSGDGWWHGVVVHGINESGEVLVQDPASYATLCFGESELLHYTIPIQNITGDVLNVGFLIVSK